MSTVESSYEYRKNPDNWRKLNHEELVKAIVREVVFADANSQHERQMKRDSIERSRRWSARVWAENRRGARVMEAVYAACREGRKTLRVADLLEVAES